MNDSSAAPATRYRVQLRNPRAFSPSGERKIVFHGVNKSGSSAMAKVLGAAYEDAGRGTEFHSHYRGAARSEDEFRRLIEQTPGPGFYVGHYLYGAFFIPRASHLLVTQFRHPLPRTVSVYQWLKRKADADGKAFPVLEDWVRRNGGRAHSQIGQFALPHMPDRARILAAMSTARMLAMAKENIERDIACIGIAEYFEESIFLFAHLCGLERVRAWKRDNRNRNRPLVWDLPPATQALIRELMHADFELYEWAVERFFAQLRRASIAGDIEAYKRDCEPQYKDRLIERDPRLATGWMARVKQALGMDPR
ncbi:MAG: hypothetical protein IPJ33_16225 [Gammaproteobacteria bacterium]|jgi:hypothetical protein|nr:hypothetical protein [Gammaproteobacteria bacterium]MBP6052400.1 hypothetical protein [Pseudomonadales bacterium]MBK6583140.1 hypothetical protein [Gammaproteobacteria bacterium]MBK7519274.1 hypothetical protein [Gammaproteobacteria bacterium]MBK7729988.1 hypothetical protein [Gammaproteobacteria bacterium]